VTEEKAATLEFAHQQVDQSIVHTPEVYRFFIATSGYFPTGYLFMEHFCGWTLDDLDLTIHTDTVFRIANIVAHFGPIRAQVQASQAPVGCGKPNGYL
jgi:hypothetical protein